MQQCLHLALDDFKIDTLSYILHTACYTHTHTHKTFYIISRNLVFCNNTILSTKDKLEAASTHKSVKTHAGNVFVTHDLDLFIQN